MEEEIGGGLLGDYVALQRIGECSGGLGSVWAGRSRDSASREALALRLCRLGSEEAGGLDRLQREVAVLRSLRHRNVLSLVRSVVVETQLLLVTPLQDYGSVADVMGARYATGLPETIIARVLLDVLSGLHYLHSLSLVHRALRPSHVLLSSHAGGCALLSGFRHTVSLHTRGTRKSALHDFGPHLHTNLLCLAPEVLAQDLGGYTCQSDVYSLGLLAVHMANGFPPFADMELGQMLMEKLRGTAPRLLDASTASAALGAAPEHLRRRFSPPFHQFAAAALQQLPDRATLPALSAFPFLKTARKSKTTLNQLLQPAVTPIVLGKNPPPSTSPANSAKSQLSLTQLWEF